MNKKWRYLSALKVLSLALAMVLLPFALAASEADLKIPELNSDQNLMLIIGLGVCVLGLFFGAFQWMRVKKYPVHRSMAEVSQTIYETCKTYLIQQGKFLILLEAIIAICIVGYFGFLEGMPAADVGLILLWSVIGIGGSVTVAAFGIRINTLANSRTAFAALEGKPSKVLNIPLQSGMSIGVLLVSVELIMMLVILLFMPRNVAGACFLGFAIGESLGASALRIAGGIFTKIADIGSDLMKIVFKIKEDDPRNPGVIADCTGDNAGDSVGPTADGFETYGVTGVALITFIVLAVASVENQMALLTWIFVLRVVMVLTSIGSYYVNRVWTAISTKGKTKIDFEAPLTKLVWMTSLVSVAATFLVSWLVLGSSADPKLAALWLPLSLVISCGTLAAAIIPELTKVFTSVKSRHVKEVVIASEEGGPSLNILSGFVAGNFSAFWQGLALIGLMVAAFFFSMDGVGDIMGAGSAIYASIFAFGLVAFGMMGMGPVTIAVDSYGPVTDNAQSVFELSLIEQQPGISEEIKKDFGFTPDFEKGKEYLEENDGCGNTFKATAKPVLIGTAVVGATTMIFGLVLVIKNVLGIDPAQLLNFLNPYSLFGLLAGGAVVYWFTGASTQAVTTGAYRAVQYIKENINLDDPKVASASVENSKQVVKICTQYAQKGMINIFIAIFSFAIAFAFLSSPIGAVAGDKDVLAYSQPVSFFVSYLIGIAIFGLFQAVFMANAGGAWDNAKKIVETEMKAKGTPLHDAAVVGDTVGDPFKDTSSVALNPIIKFTTLFGLLAMEMSLAMKDSGSTATIIGAVFFLVALVFVWRSFFAMRIPRKIQ